MIVDALLREVYAGVAVRREIDTTPYELPANLERYFAETTSVQTEASAADVACCSPVQQSSCCDSEDKAQCCGAGRCGCR